MMDPYVYERTAILINKAGLKDQKKLDNFESTMVQLAMIKHNRIIHYTTNLVGCW